MKFEHTQLGVLVGRAWPGAVVLDWSPVAHVGWEVDDAVALIRHGGETFLVTTDHGQLVRPDQPGEWLWTQIDRLSDVLARLGALYRTVEDQRQSPPSQQESR